MLKIQIKQKNPGQILIWQHIPKLEILNYFNKSKIRISQLIANVLFKQGILNQIRHCLTGHDQIWHDFFYQKILKYFNDLQNRNFSVLWLKWTQTMEMKQNLTFFHAIYSNLKLFFIGCQILKYFNDFCN